MLKVKVFDTVSKIRFWKNMDEIGGSGSILSTVVVLTHEQILALDSTPIEIVPAAGVGKVIIPTAAVYIKSGSGAYDPIDGPITLVIDAADNYNQMTNGVRASVLFGAGQRIGVDLIPATTLLPVGENTKVVSGTYGLITNGWVNKPLHVSLQSGTLVGGNIDDTLKVCANYMLVDVT